MMLFIKTKKGKEAFENAVLEMNRNQLNQIEFSPIRGGVLILVRDKTKESQDKQEEKATILGSLEKDKETFLVCRK